MTGVLCTSPQVPALIPEVEVKFVRAEFMLYTAIVVMLSVPQDFKTNSFFVIPSNNSILY